MIRSIIWHLNGEKNDTANKIIKNYDDQQKSCLNYIWQVVQNVAKNERSPFKKTNIHISK